MSRRNQGRTSSFADEPKRSNNLLEDDARILGAINQADASMQTALPTNIHELEPDPTQPRRVVPSAVRKAMPTGFRTPDLLEWWAVMAHQERYGHKPGDPHQAHFYLRSVVAGEPNERDGEPGIIEAALLRVASLAADIRARGKLIHPIHITATGRIITGERRWLAHHLLTRYDYIGFDKIMAVESEYDVWVQASENNQRSDLNAIGRARQFAILLMDLLKRDGATFEPLRAFDDEQDYYAQVADSRLHRIPTGGLNDIMNAMGIKSRSLISDYRALLALPKDVWVIADDEGWSHNDLTKIVRSSNNFDDDEQEPDGDPGQSEPVGESAAIPNIPSDDTPALVEDEHPNVKLLNLDGVPESVSWWGAYKDLSRDLPEHLFFIRARSDFFALREDAKVLNEIVPSTMPGCHYTNTEFGMTFFCPQAVIDYVAESQLVAICDMRRKEPVNDFWHTHMIKNRNPKPTQQAAALNTPKSPAPAAPPAEVQKWRPGVNSKVITPDGQIGVVVHIVNKETVSVRSPYGIGRYTIAELRPYEQQPVASGEPVFQIGDRVLMNGRTPGTIRYIKDGRYGVFFDHSHTTHYYDAGDLTLIESGDTSESDGVDLQQPQDEQEPNRFELPFTAEPDNITPGMYLVMDKNRRMVAGWRPSPAHPQESAEWLQGMVALTNGTMAHPQAQALFRMIEYLGGLAGADYFPAQAMTDLEMLRTFVDHAATVMKGGDQ